MADTKKKGKGKKYSDEALDRNFKRACAFIRPLFNLLFPMRQINQENIPEGAIIVCPNHSSNLDPFTVCLSMPKRMVARIMAKQELMKIPVVRFFLRRWGIFGVNRGNSDVGAIKTALRSLKSGRKLLLFPEGTRVKEEDESNGKTGAILLAAKTGAPILPCYCEKRKHIFQRITVVFGTPYKIEAPDGKKIPPSEYKEYAEDLMHRIYALEEQVK